MKCLPPSCHLLLATLAMLASAACGPSPGNGDQPANCGVAPVVFDPSGDVLQGSDDQGACVRLERRPVGDPGVMYKEYPYEPIRLVAAAGEHFLDVTDAGALGYTATHHNWLDEMTAVAEDGVQASVIIRYLTADGGWVLELTLSDEAGEAMVGPLELTPAGL